MAKTRKQKKEQARKLAESFDEAKGVAFVSFSGVTVSAMEDMRAKMRESDVRMQVAKKRILKIVADEKKLAIPVADYEGEMAVVFSLGDEVAAAKEAAVAGKGLDCWKMVGGILENAYIDAEQVVALSKLPSRDELIAKTVGTIKAPISGFVNVLGGSLRKLVYVLEAVKQTK